MIDPPYRELLIGCGYRRTRLIDPYLYPAQYPARRAEPSERWTHVMAVDINPRCNPDYIMDLDKGLEIQTQCPMPDDIDLFKSLGDVVMVRDSVFDEVHAYEVLEHLGSQGDHLKFFADFDELWRVLRPGGYLCATVPSRYSMWMWGDPGHRRAILQGSLGFLRRPNYDAWLETTPMTEYRDVFKGDWDIVNSYDNEDTHSFVLQAVKPARPPA